MEKELLNYVYKNAQMGVETLSGLINITEDKSFKNELKSQFEEYSSILDETKMLISKNDEDEEGLSLFEKIESYITLNIKTLKDKSSSNISEMLIIGSTMGTIQATRSINKYKGKCFEEEIKLMEKLLDTEENNIKELKKYL
ncbi:MAG: hypothetical protein ACK5LV_03795 [Lachnospirales bacterium]